MRDKNGMTPRECAHDMAIGWLRAVHEKRTGDLADLKLPPAHEREVKAQIAKLHNRLLDESGMDGIPLE